MSLISHIENSILDGYKEHIVGHKFDLDETDKGAKCTVARFEKNGGRVLAYKFDKKVTKKVMLKGTKTSENIKTPFPFFKDVEGLKYMVDYILFYENAKGKFYVLLCNMKSGNKHNCTSQIAAGETFAKFLLENISRTYHEVKSWDFIRKVVFSEKLLYKVSGKDLRKKKNAKSGNVTWNFISNEKQVDTCDLDVICN